MGCGPAGLINVSEDGSRPDPAHRILNLSRSARHGSSTFQRMGRGPAHDNGGATHETRALDMGRPMCCPAQSEGTFADLFLLFAALISLLDSLGQPMSPTQQLSTQLHPQQQPQPQQPQQQQQQLLQHVQSAAAPTAAATPSAVHLTSERGSSTGRGFP